MGERNWLIDFCALFRIIVVLHIFLKYQSQHLCLYIFQTYRNFYCFIFTHFYIVMVRKYTIKGQYRSSFNRYCHIQCKTGTTFVCVCCVVHPYKHYKSRLLMCDNAACIYCNIPRNCIKLFDHFENQPSFLCKWGCQQGNQYVQFAT